MQVKRMQNGALRILISDRELARFGASFSSLREKDPRTQHIIRQILATVCAKVDLPLVTVLSVEAAPTDGGCLLLITPRTAPPPREEDIYIFTLKDGDALLSLAAGCRQAGLLDQTILASSLFAFENEYRLILYCTALPPETAAVLGEFAEPAGTGLVPAARISEYGEAVYVGNALPMLKSLAK